MCVVSKDDKETHRISVKFLNVSPCRSSACKDGTIIVEPTRGLPLLTRVFASIGLKHVTDDTNRTVPEGKLAVDEHNVYTLDKAAVESIPHTRYGWTFGALTVPFKYQLSDKSFGSSTNIGPYLGYRFQGNEGSYTPVFSASWTTIPVAQANGSTVNGSGFSFAAGILFSIDKGTGIQAGILFGQDRLGSKAVPPYPYEGKTWTSLAIGYKFY